MPILFLFDLNVADARGQGISSLTIRGLFERFQITPNFWGGQGFWRHYGMKGTLASVRVRIAELRPSMEAAVV